VPRLPQAVALLLREGPLLDSDDPPVRDERGHAQGHAPETVLAIEDDGRGDDGGRIGEQGPDERGGAARGAERRGALHRDDLGAEPPEGLEDLTLLASLAGHDKSAGDERFIESLRFIERAAGDERNFVRKGVSWALRRIGRRNAALNTAAVTVARRLSVSPKSAARWVGRGALKELTSPAVVRQLAARRRE